MFGSIGLGSLVPTDENQEDQQQFEMRPQLMSTKF